MKGVMWSKRCSGKCRLRRVTQVNTGNFILSSLAARGKSYLLSYRGLRCEHGGLPRRWREECPTSQHFSLRMRNHGDEYPMS